MSSDRKPVVLSCLILLGVFVLCCCAVTVFVMAMAVLPGQLSNIRPGLEPTPFDLESLPTPAMQDNSSELPAGVLSEMRRIQQDVITERQLLPEIEIPRSFLTPEELRTIVENEFFADYTEEMADLDAKVLSTFGLVEPDHDLLQFYQDLYSEQIAGFYDPETGEMKVIKGGEFGLNERITYAHEYTHVLQDQNFHIEENLRYSEEYCKNEAERCTAVQALIEGDASLSEYQWQSDSFSPREMRDWLSASLDMQFPTLDAAAPFFQQDLYFPYLYGLNFVSYLYDRGGWDAVNAVYKNPPVSTEQIMHPESYPDDKPQKVAIHSLSANILRPYALIDEGEAGEWFTVQYLSQGINEGFRLNESNAKDAAAGWDGGYYKVYFHPYTEGMLLITCNIWDDKAEAQEFFSVFKVYGDQRWVNRLNSSSDTMLAWETDESYANILLGGTRTCWILGPDQVTVNAASEIAMRN